MKLKTPPAVLLLTLRNSDEEMCPHFKVFVSDDKSQTCRIILVILQPGLIILAAVAANADQAAGEY